MQSPGRGSAPAPGRNKQAAVARYLLIRSHQQPGQLVQAAWAERKVVFHEHIVRRRLRIPRAGATGSARKASSVCAAIRVVARRASRAGRGVPHAAGQP